MNEPNMEVERGSGTGFAAWRLAEWAGFPINWPMR